MLTYPELSQQADALVQAYLDDDLARVHTLYDRMSAPGGLTYDRLMHLLTRRNLNPDLVSGIGALLTRRFIVEATP